MPLLTRNSEIRDSIHFGHKKYEGERVELAPLPALHMKMQPIGVEFVATYIFVKRRSATRNDP